jgi:N6-adenosine-specific RNA methylase IME4
MDAVTTNTTGLEAALAAPAPFVGLRRGYYGAIAIDPASKFKSYTSIQSQNPQSRRDNERHYRTMSFAELAALPVKELAAPACHLFIWTSGPFLPQALKLIEIWGFRYSTRCFTWLKTKRSWKPGDPLTELDFPIGLGLTTRAQSEIVLLARRGNCRRLRKDVRELILAPRREHSRKPDEFYRRVEAYCEGPFVDLFARERRPGWSVWGDEIDKYGERPRPGSGCQIRASSEARSM